MNVHSDFVDHTKKNKQKNQNKIVSQIFPMGHSLQTLGLEHYPLVKRNQIKNDSHWVRKYKKN